MMTYQEKLVLSGGRLPKPFFDAATDLSGASNPHFLVDMSPSADELRFSKNKNGIEGVFNLLGIRNYTLLQDSFSKQPTQTEALDRIEETDILCVLGGSTRRAYAKWQEWGIVKRVRDRVAKGELVGSGGSAGAMIWFATGYSDSNQYEVGDGEYWDYSLVTATGVLPAWVTAHHGDTDAFQRLRSRGFREFLDTHEGEWQSAIGLDTWVTLICTDGLGRAVYSRDIESDRPHTVTVYTGEESLRARILQHNETIDLRDLESNLHC